jgi:hypothetical protein
MNRRQNDRVSRRLEVQFWQAGQKTRRGYSTNVSPSGMHIATAEPLPPHSRLRIEVMHGDRGFLIEGVVAHRRAVHPELFKVMPPGMGVRFLRPEELIRELFPPQAAKDRPAAGAAAGPGEPVISPLDLPEPAAPGTEARIFSVRFASARDFLGTYERDIVNGGLFVSTSRPGKLREVVRVELHPPAPGVAPLLLPARVVQRFQPEPGSGAILVGMGVELLDLQETLARLQPVVERLSSLAT